MSITIAMSLDLKGSHCPMPIIKTAKAMKDMLPASRSKSLPPTPVRCPTSTPGRRTTGNPLVEPSQDAGVFRFVLKKKEFRHEHRHDRKAAARAIRRSGEKKAEQAEKLVIFAWSGELDKIWPTLILATTGAAMGKETTVFFTFWGLFPLVKNEVRITGENWMQKMLSMMNRGGDRAPEALEDELRRRRPGDDEPPGEEPQRGQPARS